MLDAFLQTLRQDTDLYFIIRDRIFDARDVHEISRNNTPEAFDDRSEILPCLYVKHIADGRIPQYLGGVTMTIQIYCYERHGYRNTSRMRAICKALLHDRQLVPLAVESEGIGNWRVWHDDDVLQIDDEGQGISLEISNYRILTRLPGYDD